MKDYDYAGAYTEHTIGHALMRGLRATSYISAEILDDMDTLGPAEAELARDAIEALENANKAIGRLAYLPIDIRFRATPEAAQ